MNDSVSMSGNPVSMSDSPPTDQPTGEGANFTSNTSGQNPGLAEGTTSLMPEGGWLAINGNMNLSSCIVGNSDASVSQIYVSDQPPAEDPYHQYQYCVWVYGQGPAGAGSGRLWLTFADQTGATYDLSLYSSSPAWHYVSYDSGAPGIVSVYWTNGGFAPPAPAA